MSPVNILSSFTTSTGRSFKYLKDEYPAPKSSKAIFIPLAFNLVRESEAVLVSPNSAVSVTSKPNSLGSKLRLSTKSVKILQNSGCITVWAETFK